MAEGMYRSICTSRVSDPLPLHRMRTDAKHEAGRRTRRPKGLKRGAKE